MTRPRRAQRKSSIPWLPILFGVLIAGSVTGWIVFERWLNQYLASDAFRKVVIASLSENLEANEIRIDSIRWDGSSLFCNQIGVSGFHDGIVHEIVASEVRATMNLRAVFRREWHVTRFQAGRVEIQLIEGRSPRETVIASAVPPTATEGVEAAPDTLPLPVTAKNQSWFLPNKLVWDEAVIDEARLRWKLKDGKFGSLEKTTVKALAEAGGVVIESTGGNLEQSGLQALRLESASLRYRLEENQIYLTKAKLLPASGGTAALSGEIDLQPSTQVSLQLDLNGIQITPLLREDWRARLSGELHGRVHIALGQDQPTLIEGPVELKNANLRALPVLDQISLFTGVGEFRNMPIQTASATMKISIQESNTRIDILNFSLESQGLLKSTGDITVDGDLLAGNLKVGVTRRSLQWIPGAQEKVFNLQEGAYFWADLKLSGTLSDPKEDLSPRLTAAAAEKILDSAGGAVEKAGEKAGGLIREASDLLNRVLGP